MTMEPDALRFEILQTMDQHESTGSSAYLDDTVIAEQLHVPLSDVQRQLVVLEDHELVELLKTMSRPTYSALLTPKGMQTLADANSQPTDTARRIGF
jgi:hypothetical protein